MLRRASSLKGYHLGAINGEIGHLDEFYFDDEDWHVRYLVADTGSWLSHRKVLISPHAFGPIEDEQKVITILLTREQIENSPSIDVHKPVSRQFEERYFTYYGWPFYWMDPLGIGMPVVYPGRGPTETEPAEKPKGEDLHLRSTSEVTGYHIQARDGEVGHVEDFLLDDSDWEIRDLIVDTRNWLPGKHVLVSPDWIKEVSWKEAKVFVNLNRKSLLDSQEFNPYELAEEDAKRRVRKAYEHMAYLP